MRQFLSRNMQHSLQQQPHIPVGVLLKPLVKSATLYGYNNCDFDFFLTLHDNADGIKGAAYRR